jgi:Kef-type K+ transport system membrane component KefB
MDTLITQVIGEIALVMVVSSILGGLAQRCRQPKVVGQIISGIILGPSLLGALPGHLSDRLFPHATLPFLTALAQVAVVIFMFVVGYELDLRTLGRRSRAVPLVAIGALLVPMSLGSGAAVVFRRGFAALGEVHSGHSFVLFMGVAVSITALPVLAAIARERGIADTVAGITAMSAAGIMDVVAWLVLAAALVGTAHQPGRPWPLTLLLLSGFVVVMLVAVRPGLRWWITRGPSGTANQLAIALVLAMGSAWVTAWLGLHAVFGGFLAGLTMPSADGTPDAEVLRPMEEAGNLLLPLFFVVTGLSLNVGTLNGEALALLAGICAIAICGKLGPAYAAARIGGLDTRESAAVSVLVNARGLTELIALNVGLSAHLINQRLFTVLVLMALITTFATSPLLSLVRLPKVRPVISEPFSPAQPRAGAEGR